MSAFVNETLTPWSGKSKSPPGRTICSLERSSAAGHPSTYRAWLSTTPFPDAVARIANGGAGWRLSDGALVATSLADLTDGTLAAAISQDENGAAVVGVDNVWTGTNSFGGGERGFGDMCAGWTDAGGTLALTGSSSAADSTWSATLPAACSEAKRIYCFEDVPALPEPTDPLDPDTDGDGVSDGDEVQAGTDPNDANSFPGSAALVPALGRTGLLLLGGSLACLGTALTRRRQRSDQSESPTPSSAPR